MRSQRRNPTLPRPLAFGLGAALLAAALVGCGDGGNSAMIDAGPLYSCAMEARALPYADLTRTSASGAYRAALVSADPASPAKNTNTWTIEILDASAAPVGGLAITPSLFMPDHGHSPLVKPVATPAGDGTYKITPLYFFMAGYWEVTLTFQPAGGPKETVMFPICVPG